MRQFRLKYFFLALLSGILIAVSFQKFNAFFCAWIGLVPLIYCSLRNCVRNSFVYGFIAGFACYAVSLFWFIPFLRFNTGSYIQALAASILLWCYLSLYFAVWSAVLSFSRRHLQQAASGLFAASAWVALEFVRTYFLTGFPWNLLGYSQYSFVNIIQISEIVGVYGVSFVIVFINMMLYYWLREISEKKYLYIAGIVFAALFVFGFVRTNKFNDTYGGKLTAGIVQPGIDQYKKWDYAYQNEILEVLKQNSKYFENKNIDMTVWPETVIPGFFQNDFVLRDAVAEIVKNGRINLLGAPVADGDKNIYNSVFAVNSQNQTVNRHNKNHLVVFGEYVPFRTFLGGYFGVLNTLGDFKKDKGMQVFRYDNIFIGSTICSENFFPDLSRQLALNGAKIFTNHTNDAWFFDTAAPYQHFIMNVFRAVENRKNIVVSANSGVSGVISAGGHILSQKNVGEKTAFVSDVYQNDYLTLYSRYGNVFVYMCGLFVLFMLVIIFVI